MTLDELLGAIRAAYVQQFSEAVKALDAHVEAALRKADGSLAENGMPPTPVRVDYVLRKAQYEPGRVDARTRLSFEPFVIKYGNCPVTISPFTWDWVRFECDDVSIESLALLVKPWFMKWFDPEDRNAPDELGVHRVVHFVSEVEKIDSGFAFTADLGTAPIAAIHGILDLLANYGASAVRVR